jgi:hypothetical protein
MAGSYSGATLSLDGRTTWQGRSRPDRRCEAICLNGLLAFVERNRFRSVATLRRDRAENRVEVVGDLHGCPGEKGPARLGSGIV